jgi:hypothetical protein
MEIPHERLKLEIQESKIPREKHKRKTGKRKEGKGRGKERRKVGKRKEVEMNKSQWRRQTESFQVCI